MKAAVLAHTELAVGLGPGGPSGGQGPTSPASPGSPAHPPRAQALDGILDVVGLAAGLQVSHCRQHQLTRLRQSATRDTLMPSAYGYLINTTQGSFSGSAKAAGHARKVLQLKRNMLENVTCPGAVLESAQKSTALSIAAAMLDQRRKPGRKALVKTGDGI